MDQPTEPGDYWYTCIYGRTVAHVYGSPHALQSRTPWAYGNGPVAMLPGQWELIVDPDVLASARRRIKKLEALVELSQSAERAWAQTALATEAREQGYRQQVEALNQTLTDARRTAELAVGEMDHMRVGALWETVMMEFLPRLREVFYASTRSNLVYGNTNVMDLFEAAVAQVQGERTMGESR